MNESNPHNYELKGRSLDCSLEHVIAAGMKPAVNFYFPSQPGLASISDSNLI